MFQIFRNVELEITEDDTQVINIMRGAGKRKVNAQKLYNFTKVTNQKMAESWLLLITLKSRGNKNARN